MKCRHLLPIFIILFLYHPGVSAQCCNYKLSMHDSYGDGWNGGGHLEVFINNISIGTFSASNFGSLDSFQVCNGDSLILNYTPGTYENENSYQLYDPSWNLVFHDGPTPQTGYVDTSIGNCAAPAMLGNNPCVAIPIDTTQCLFQNNTNFQGSGLNPNCAAYQGADVWFTMIVPPSGSLSFATDSGTINDTGLGVWTGSSCTNLHLLGCDDDAGVGNYSFLMLYGLTPGQTLYIQVWGYGSSMGTFQLCVHDLGTVILDSSELPIVMINTLGQTIVENTKINAMMDIKYNGLNNITHVSDSANVYHGNIGIEIRGATSAGYPQHPYGLETRDTAGANNNVSILGMPAENDWVLLSNFNDRSLIRNTLAYKLFGDMGNYSPRTHLCEVLVDSAYKGIYVFGEKIKQGNNRVNIAKLTAADTMGDNLTGGYILGQNYWDASNSFQSNYSPIDHPGFDVHFLYEYPKPATIHSIQKTYIASYVDSMETALYSASFADTTIGYRKYLDIKSFIDYFLVNELSRNNDGFKKSVFFNKDKFSNGGKLKAGPVWDFDWSWKNIDNCITTNSFDGSGWAHHVNDCPTDNYSTGWYIRLLQDSTFNNELRCTYENYRQNILDTLSIFAYIDSMKNRIPNAQARHFQKWPILGISGPAPEAGAIATTYSAEMDTLKIWIKKRLTWLDANIPGHCILQPNSTENLNDYNYVRYFPNPSSNGLFHFEGELKNQSNVQLSVYTITGELIDERNLKSGKINFDLKLNQKGIFFFKITGSNGILQYGKIVAL